MEDAEREALIDELVDGLLLIDVEDSINIGSSEGYPILDEDEWVIDEVNNKLGPDLHLINEYGQVILTRI